MTPFAAALKTWRQRRRFSQLDLALEADVSARHVSFLETARARPSRDMVLRLAEALTMPLEARNHLLTQAGYATCFSARPLDDAALAPIRAAVTRMLSTHSPYPGMALDRDWTVVEMNPTAAHLYGLFGVGVGDSLLDLLTRSDISAVIDNWPQLSASLVTRLRAESAALGGHDRFEAVADHLSAHGGALPETTPEPVIPLVLNFGGMRLSLFATIASFGTPQDVTLDDLRVELYFPMDEESAAVLDALPAG